MTKAQKRASEKLAEAMKAETGNAWRVDYGNISGEAVMMCGDFPGGWREVPMVTRDRSCVVDVNPYHPEYKHRKRLGMYKGLGWQERAAKDAAKLLPIGEVKP